jgi:hypothetical protein
MKLNYSTTRTARQSRPEAMKKRIMIGDFGIDESNLTEIRNLDNHLVAKLDKITGSLVIQNKDCITIFPNRKSGDVTAIYFRNS